jgi:hypothetical protein
LYTNVVGDTNDDSFSSTLSTLSIEFDFGDNNDRPSVVGAAVVVVDDDG